ncbi:MAG: hypothetical protein IJ301_02475 [Clostridia bacterium]|nr:hypothetical protein [Clostridia bacterium]
MSKIEKNEGEAIQVKTVTKKRGGCGSFLMGFIFCFVFMLVCVGGVGLYCYYNVTINTVENMLGVEIPLEGEYKDMALKDLLNVALNEKNKITDATLESIQTDFGVELPETIPGTDISLMAVYETEVDFLNTRKQVNQYRIQDIANNLDEFVDAVLPVLYDTTTVDQVLTSLQITALDEMGYPALTDSFYNVGTASAPNMKTLRELTISQALDIIPEYFGEDNLTVQRAIDALGLEILPYPASGEKDIYAPLRPLVIADLTMNKFMEKATGEMLNEIIDLSTFKFTQTDGFKNTTLNNMSDYLETVSLDLFVEIPEEITDESSATDKILNLLRGLTYGDLKNPDIGATLMAEIDESENPNITIGELMNIQDATGIMSFIKNVKFKDMLGTDPKTAIMDAITGTTENPVTLGQLLKLEETSGIISLIQNVKMGDLIGDSATPADAIMNALKAEGNTLGTLLEITETTGFAGKIANITLEDLLNGGSSATQAIKDTVDTMTLGEVFGDNVFDSTHGDYNKIFAALGKDTAVKDIPSKIDDLKLSDVAGAKSGVFTLIANYDCDYTDSNTIVHKQVTLGTFDDIVLVENITIQNLYDAGMITEEQYNSIIDKNVSISDIIDAYIAAQNASS